MNDFRSSSSANTSLSVTNDERTVGARQFGVVAEQVERDAITAVLGSAGWSHHLRRGSMCDGFCPTLLRVRVDVGIDHQVIFDRWVAELDVSRSVTARAMPVDYIAP